MEAGKEVWGGTKQAPTSAQANSERPMAMRALCIGAMRVHRHLPPQQHRSYPAVSDMPTPRDRDMIVGDSFGQLRCLLLLAHPIQQCRRANSH
jgi:hypothetical protein